MTPIQTKKTVTGNPARAKFVPEKRADEGRVSLDPVNFEPAVRALRAEHGPRSVQNHRPPTGGTMSKLAEYWKGILAFVAPGAVIIGSSVLTGSDGGTAITGAEWVTALVACVITGGLVTAKSNAAPTS